MLDIQGTKEKFGYDPTTLKRYSERPILLVCDYCGKSHQTLYVRFYNSPGMTCGNKDCRNKLTEKTCLAKYGTRHHLCSTEVKEARKQSNLLRYGVEHIAQIPEVREKQRKSNLAAYAQQDENGNSIIVEKIKQTHRTKYGQDFAILNADIKGKAVNTTRDRYGVENPFANKEIAQKARQAKIEKYGTASGGNYGKVQKSIQDWLQGLTGKPFYEAHSILDGKEIDMYCEELSLGVEYCGLYWHTEDSRNPRPRNYHGDKLKAANQKGIRLITIFEDEWVYRQEQVKNFLRSVLKAHTNVVYARKTEVVEISPKAAQAFFDTYHIQGKNTLGMYFAGLFHGEELVAAMSFGRHHRDSSQLTLDRFAVKTGIHVPGGASKLFKFLIHASNTSKVISWSDNRWSAGNVYRQLGFTLEEELPPDYSYVDFSHNCRRVSKQSQRKAKTGCPAHMTEQEFAKTKNLHRIWDCGKLRWVYHK
jgi:hypothetical protein